MNQHKCKLSDGMIIVCLCVRGFDHSEEDFDIALDAYELAQKKYSQSAQEVL